MQSEVTHGKKRSIPASISSNDMLLERCKTLLESMRSHQLAWVFNKPIDDVELNNPDYFTVINALFVSTLTFSEKLFIFQRAFSRKLSHFLVFGNDLENELENVI